MFLCTAVVKTMPLWSSYYWGGECLSCTGFLSRTWNLVYSAGRVFYSSQLFLWHQCTLDYQHMLIPATLVSQLRVCNKQLREQQLLEPPLTGRPLEAILQQSAQLFSFTLALQHTKNFSLSDTNFGGSQEAHVWSQYKFLNPINSLLFCEA